MRHTRSEGEHRPEATACEFVCHSGSLRACASEILAFSEATVESFSLSTARDVPDRSLMVTFIF